MSLVVERRVHGRPRWEEVARVTEPVDTLDAVQEQLGRTFGRERYAQLWYLLADESPVTLRGEWVEVRVKPDAL